MDNFTGIRLEDYCHELVFRFRGDLVWTIKKYGVKMPSKLIRRFFR